MLGVDVQDMEKVKQRQFSIYGKLPLFMYRGL